MNTIRARRLSWVCRGLGLSARWPTPTNARKRGIQLDFEHEKLEVLVVIVNGDTPLAIVVLEHQRVLDANPRTPHTFPL
jgi:hypothetical protein